MRRAIVAASVLVASGACAALAACSANDATPTGAAIPRATENEGSVGLRLQVGGTTINSVSYTLTGPNSFSQTGTINVTNSTSISALLGGIPAGSGYTITLTAVSTDGTLSCAGASAPFTVVAQSTTTVAVTLNCSLAALDAGSVLINGTTNSCPTIDSISASPASVNVGGSMAVVGSVREPGGTPSYSWTATSGTFSSASSASTAFTCTAAGSAVLTLTATGGDAAPCNATSSATVTCTGVGD